MNSKNKNRILALTILLLLSPFTAEVLTGATRLWDFINPIVMALLVGLYGFGALMIREAKLYLDLQYSGILLLGFAYGIIEEGLAVKSFFNPYWKDLGIFGVYGRWMGVNWVWTVYLTIFHGVWSILAPIVIVEALYPQLIGKHWLGRKTLTLIAIIFSIDVVIINILLTSYQPGIQYYMLSLLLILALVYLALKYEKNNIVRRTTTVSPKRYGAYWALWGIGFFTGFYIVSSIIPQPIIPITIGVLLGIVAIKLTKIINNKLHKYWLYIGVIAPLIFIDIILALKADIERLITLMIILTILIQVYRKISKTIQGIRLD